MKKRGEKKLGVTHCFFFLAVPLGSCCFGMKKSVPASKLTFTPKGCNSNTPIYMLHAQIIPFLVYF